MAGRAAVSAGGLPAAREEARLLLVEPTARRSSPAFASVTDGIRAQARRTPTAPAVRQGARALDFAGLIERTERVAGGALHGLGVPSGSRAAVFAPNCLEYLELVLGLSDAGIAPVLVGATLTPRDLALVCDDCDARVLFVHPALEEVARAAELETVEQIVVLGESYEAWLAGARPERPERARSGEEPFVVRYTSGTTARPKGVVVSQRASVTRFGRHAATFGFEGPAECSLAVSPLSAGSALTYALTTLLGGGSCVVMPIFHPEAFLRELERSRVTNAYLVPTHVRSILALVAGERRLGRSRLRILGVGGAALPRSDRELVAETLGDVLHVTYGSTETATIALLPPRDALRKPDSVGLPFAGVEIRVVRDDGSEAPTGEPGELCVRSEIMFDGYWARAQDASVLVDGFFPTGDLGLLDEEGYVHLTGRADDRINSAGFSFHPAGVEEVLAGHPSVLEAAVIGVPDRRLGEAVHAVVVCRPGAPEDARALLAWTAPRLARERRPKTIEFADALPRTATGKLSRRALRDRRATPAPGPGAGE